MTAYRTEFFSMDEVNLIRILQDIHFPLPTDVVANAAIISYVSKNNLRRDIAAVGIPVFRTRRISTLYTA